MDIQQKLQELELELAEGRMMMISIDDWNNCSASGDITQKGFEKKRIKLLAPYQPKQSKIKDSMEEDEEIWIFRRCGTW